MNYLKKIISIFIILCLFSCGNKNETKQEKETRKEIIKIIKDLPNLKKEMDQIEKKLDAKSITGTFEMSVDDKAKNISKFSGKKSNIRFFKDNAIFMVYTNKDRQEHIYINIRDKELFTNLKDNSFIATHYTDLKNMERTKKLRYKNIQVVYVNKKTNERFSSSKGTIILTKLSNTQLKLTYNNQGKKGDYRENNFVPMIINLNLNYNFLTLDNRNK